MVVVGVCALCQETKSLCLSHLIPAFIHRLVKRNQELVVVASDKTYSSSLEIREHLLCSACEEVFGKAERSVSQLFIQRDGRFPLRDRLLDAPTLVGDEYSSVKSGRALRDEELKMLTYFALSVFWRGSVGTWEYGGRRPKKNCLGGKYEETLRRYLLGKADVPDSMSLMVMVSRRPVPIPFIHVPVSSRNHGYHVHRFYIPGMQFILNVGQIRPKGCDDLCVQRSLERPIVFSTLTERIVEGDTLHIMRTSVVSKRLLESRR